MASNVSLRPFPPNLVGGLRRDCLLERLVGFAAWAIKVESDAMRRVATLTFMTLNVISRAKEWEYGNMGVFFSVVISYLHECFVGCN